MKKFEAPELKIEFFAVQDVISTSGGVNEGGGGNNDLPIMP